MNFLHTEIVSAEKLQTSTNCCVNYRLCEWEPSIKYPKVLMCNQFDIHAICTELDISDLLNSEGTTLQSTYIYVPFPQYEIFNQPISMQFIAKGEIRPVGVNQPAMYR